MCIPRKQGVVITNINFQKSAQFDNIYALLGGSMDHSLTLPTWAFAKLTCKCKNQKRHNHFFYRGKYKHCHCKEKYLLPAILLMKMEHRTLTGDMKPHATRVESV